MSCDGFVFIFSNTLHKNENYFDKLVRKSKDVKSARKLSVKLVKNKETQNHSLKVTKTES